MDLRTAEQLNGKLWQHAKVGALLCFFVASLLLLVSLISAGGEESDNAAGVNATTSAIR
jgi:hypothetical protein